MEQQPETFDVILDGKVAGVAHDTNPVVINDNDECVTQLQYLKSTLTLSNRQSNFLDKCIKVATATEGDDVSFDMMDILKLSFMAKQFPTQCDVILACSNYLTDVVEFEGTLPAGSYLDLAQAYGSLGTLLNSGLKNASKTNQDEINKDDSDDDMDSVDDIEEELWISDDDDDMDENVNKWLKLTNLKDNSFKMILDTNQCNSDINSNLLVSTIKECLGGDSSTGRQLCNLTNSPVSDHSN